MLSVETGFKNRFSDRKVVTEGYRWGFIPQHWTISNGSGD